MCDGHQDLHQNVERLALRIKALEDQNEWEREVWQTVYKKAKAIQDENNEGRVAMPHARREPYDPM